MANYTVIGVGQHKKFFDENAYHDATNYIFNPEKAAYIGGAGISSAQTAAEEMQKTAVKFGKDKGKRVRHSVLSFDERENVTPEQANEYAQAIIQHYSPEYQIAYAVHTNTSNVHIHMVMNQVSYLDGHRYEGKKKDYYAFKKYMGSVTHDNLSFQNLIIRWLQLRDPEPEVPSGLSQTRQMSTPYAHPLYDSHICL